MNVHELRSGAAPATPGRPRPTFAVSRGVAAAASSRRSGAATILWGTRSASATSFFHIDVSCLTLNTCNYLSTTKLSHPSVKS